MCCPGLIQLNRPSFVKDSINSDFVSGKAFDISRLNSLNNNYCYPDRAQLDSRIDIICMGAPQPKDELVWYIDY